MPQTARAASDIGGRSLQQLFLVALVIILAIPIIPLFFATWHVHTKEVRELQTQLLEANEHMASLVRRSFRLLLDHTAAVLVERPETGGPLNTQVFSAWIETDSDGNIVAAYPKSGGIALHLPPDIAWRTVNGDSGTTFDVTDVTITPVTDYPTILLRVALENEPGAHRIAFIDTTYLREWFMASYPSFMQRHVYVVDGSGHPIFYSNPGIEKNLEAFLQNPPVRRFLDGGSGGIRYVSSVSGKERVGAVVPMPETGYGIIVSADIGKQLLNLRERALWNIGALILGAGITLIIFYYFARRLILPIQVLTGRLQKQGAHAYDEVRLPGAGATIREYHLLEQQLNRYLSVLKQAEESRIYSEKLATLGELTAGLAHELGTPLNVMRGNAQMILKRKDLDDIDRQRLEAIVNQTKRIAQLIRNLLDLARSDQSAPSELCLQDVIRDAAEPVREMFSGVAVRLDLPKDDLVIIGNRRGLEHAFLNLFMNACHAMDGQGTLAVTAERTGDSRGDYTVIRVADTGSGIPEELREKVFQPFFSTKGSGQGSGLGLALVDRVVKDHGGEVRVDPDTKSGAVFVLKFPLAAEESDGATEFGRI